MIADRYRLERKVGGGRVSAVWRVHDQFTDAPCAVKLLHRSMHKHAEALTRFSLEERLARELSGPHFPERVGSGSWDGMRYIAWRWHEGESLRALFERNPKQDAPTVHSIAQETCEALSIVHAAGYTHGDIKPENLYFADAGDKSGARQLKLLGFGVASRISSFSASPPRRKPGTIVGTPLYLSPELILGRAPKGGQADLWALAVVVYEALTGRAPFLGSDLGAVVEAILKRDAPKPSALAEHLPGTFDLWWSQALEQEFKTPSEFASSLSRALAPALRSSHTQRSAALPERPAASVLPERPAATAPPELATAGPAQRPAAPEPSPVAAAVQQPPAAAKLLAAAEPLAAALAAAAASGRSITASGIGPAHEVERRGDLKAAHEARPLELEAPRPSATPGKTAGAHAGERRAAASVPSGSADDDVAARTSATEPVATPEREGSSGSSEPAEALAPNPLESKAAETAPEAHGHGAGISDAQGANTFAPLAPPLRDLATTSRKTLVGITPPRPLGSTLPGGSMAPVPAQPAAEVAPSKGIHISAVVPVEDSFFSAAESLRRPNNPTVPFPRPRVQPRVPGAASEPFPGASGRPETATWRGSTSQTVRFVLTSPDHKPQRVAAVVVCAAAALVIFAINRSPIAGTASIGQARGALSTEPGKSAPQPRPADPSAPSAETTPPKPSGVEGQGREAPLAGRELAPGLVIPQGEAQPAAGSSLVPGEAAGPSSSPSRSRPPRAAPRAAGTDAPPRARPAPPQPRAEPAPSSRRSAPEPPQPSKSGGDFDFGF